MDRLHEIVNVIRAVGGPNGGVEAFDPGDAAQAASAVIALHASLRDRTVTINAVAPPVRTHRWIFVRALIVLVGRAAAADRRAPISLDLTEHDGWIHVAATGASAGGPSPYIHEIAVVLGGEPLAEGSGFRIPSLAALRQREGR